MALIKCPECGRDITDTNEICIHCGCPIIKKKGKKIVPVIVGLGVVVVIVMELLLKNGGTDL